MDIAYIKGADNLPVIASVHSLDIETEKRFFFCRFSALKIKKPYSPQFVTLCYNNIKFTAHNSGLKIFYLKL